MTRIGFTEEQRREFPHLAEVFRQLEAGGFVVDPIGFNPSIRAYPLAREIFDAVTKAERNSHEAMMAAISRPVVVTPENRERIISLRSADSSLGWPTPPKVSDVPIAYAVEDIAEGDVMAIDLASRTARRSDLPASGYRVEGDRMYCRHGLILYGDSCVTCEREGAEPLDLGRFPTVPRTCDMADVVAAELSSVRP